MSRSAAENLYNQAIMTIPRRDTPLQKVVNVIDNVIGHDASQRLGLDRTMREGLVARRLSHVLEPYLKKWVESPKTYKPILISLIESLKRGENKGLIVEALHAAMVGVTVPKSANTVLHDDQPFRNVSARKVTIMAGMMGVINVTAAAVLLWNYARSEDNDKAMGARRAISAFVATATSTILLRKNTIDPMNWYAIFVGVLTTVLSQYAASDPQLMQGWVLRTKHDPRADLETLMLQHFDFNVVASTYHLELAFIFSIVWPFVTFLVCFGGTTYYRASLMLLINHSLAVSNFAHVAPGLGIAAAHRWRPSDLPLMGPDTRRQDISVQHQLDRNAYNRDCDEFESRDGGGFFTDLSRYILPVAKKVALTDKRGVSHDMAAGRAADYAFDFLNIMQVLHHQWSLPIFYDAHNGACEGKHGRCSPSEPGGFYSSGLNHDLNFMSFTLTPSHAFTYDEMVVHANHAVRSAALNRNLFASRYDTYDAIEEFGTMVTLMEPTIRAYLYAFFARNFGQYEYDGLGLKIYEKNGLALSDDTIEFLNRMDHVFFQYCYTELGLHGRLARYNGRSRFFYYSNKKKIQ